MSGGVEFGATSEIWLAPSDDHAGNKHSFLVRDDAYVVSEATFGRQIRLGQPIDLGPNGSWNQEGWFGGYDQERWNDEFMYEDGSVDTTDRIGRVKLWPGWEQVVGRKTRPEATIKILLSGGVGAGENTPLIAAEGIGPVSGTPTSGYALFSARPGEANTAVHFGTRSIRAIAPIANEAGDSTGWYLIGDLGGQVYRYNQEAGTVSLDSGSFGFDGTKPIDVGGIQGYNGATYYGRGRELYRRAYGGGTHTLVKSIGVIDRIRGMVVWQNRLWFLGVASGGKTSLYTSDGVTAVAAIDFPLGFQGWTLQPHYGSLYIGGDVFATPGGEPTSGQVWRYNGSSLTKLWDGRSADQEGFSIQSMCSWDRFVVWGRHGSTALGRRAGVWLYDAEEDAILEGPSIDMDPAATAYNVTAVCEWNQTIAIALQDRRTIASGTYDNPYVIAFLRQDGGLRWKDNPNDSFGVWGSQSFGYEPSTVTRSLTSSEYHAELLGEEKLWLSAFIRCKVPENSQLRFAVQADNGSEVPVGTITYNGETGWRNITLDIDDGGSNVKGTTLKYTLYLENTDSGNEDTTATPEVDFVGIQFQPAAERRLMWYVRVVASDGQSRVNGDPNDLTTRQDIVDKLLEYWRANKTLSFWQRQASGGEPADGSEVKVTISNFSEQPWRLSTTDGNSVSEIAFSLLEVTPT